MIIEVKLYLSLLRHVPNSEKRLEINGRYQKDQQWARSWKC